MHNNGPLSVAPEVQACTCIHSPEILLADTQLLDSFINSATVYNAMFPTSLLAVLAAAAIVCSADAAALNCTGRYQAVLQQALSIKEDCGIIDFKDCCQVRAAAVFQAKPETGVYIIDDVCAHKETFQEQATVRAKCDVEGEDSGWLVIMRRDNTIASSQYVDFSRDWVDYVNGFGELNTEFWYGLRNMHCLTSREEVDLRINFKKTDGTEETYLYHTFRVGGAHTNYALTIGGFQTPAPGGDWMNYHNGAAFTTRDADHDTQSNNCATDPGQGAGGGWWFKRCRHSVFTSPHSSLRKIYWLSNNYADMVEMQVRAKTCAAN